MGPVGRTIAIGVGALGAYGALTALLDRNDTAVPEADHAMARRNAEQTLAHVDWNRPIIAISVPSTGWGFASELKDGLARHAGSGRISEVKLEYPAAAHDMPTSVALGEESLRLVLEEIQRRDPVGTRYHVALQGESQGAWVINDVLAEHPFASTVDRVALYGLPRSATHDGALRDDARVRVTNDPWDPIAWPYLGPAGLGTAGIGLIIGHDGRDTPAALLGMALNPVHAAALGVGQLATMFTGRPSAHPHVYTEHYGDEAPEFLLS
jgi:hypothetical protein